MEKFKTLATSRPAVFIGGAVLALLVTLPFVSSAQDKTDKTKDPDPHAKHKDAPPAGDKNLASQIAELHAKVAKLEAALAKTQAGMSGSMGKMKDDKMMSGMSDKKKGMAGMGMEDDMMMGGMGAKKKGMGMVSGFQTHLW